MLILCGLCWLIFLIGIAVDRKDWVWVLLGGAIITVVPLVLGIFLVKKGSRPKAESDGW